MPKTGDDWRTPPAAPPGHDVGTTALVAAVRELAGRVGDLLELVGSNNTARRTNTALLGATLAMLVVIAIAGGLFVSRLTELAGANRTSNRILIECTTPADPAGATEAQRHHPCYERSLANQAAAVAQITDTNHNGVPDTVEILANQQVLAAQRGVTLPDPKTLTTTKPPG